MISEGGAMRQPRNLRPISGLSQRHRQGAATHANDQKNQKNGPQADGGKDNESMRGGKPLQHLLGLRIGILGGNLVNPGDHQFAILRPPNGNGDKEACQKESKAQRSHHGAHPGAFSGANSERPVPAITDDGPDQVGGKKNEEAERGKRHSDNAGDSGQGSGRMDEILPGNPDGRGKAARWRKRPFRGYGWQVLLLFRDVKRLLRRGNPDLWRATSGTKGDLPFHRTSATVANILHTFLK